MICAESDSRRTRPRIYQLKVNQQPAIVGLFAQGWSARRIARELGVDRDTVVKYVRGA
jgi:DNA-binding NarL/FixJ family response regulator